MWKYACTRNVVGIWFLSDEITDENKIVHWFSFSGCVCRHRSVDLDMMQCNKDDCGGDSYDIQRTRDIAHANVYITLMNSSLVDSAHVLQTNFWYTWFITAQRANYFGILGMYPMLRWDRQDFSVHNLRCFIVVIKLIFRCVVSNRKLIHIHSISLRPSFPLDLVSHAHSARLCEMRFMRTFDELSLAVSLVFELVLHCDAKS